MIVLLLALAGPIACGGGSEPARRAVHTPEPAGVNPTAAAVGSTRARVGAARVGAARLAAELRTTDRTLAAAIDSWRARGDPARGGPPGPVAAAALAQQRLYLRLAAHPRLARRVLARLGSDRVAGEARDVLRAERSLAKLNSGARPHRIRIGRAEPAGALLSDYREAQRRSHVSWPILAAVNFVESAFGRLRNDSVAGARGPMQFMPSTWAAYGRGGDVHDPRDAILAAARFLHAAGAPRRERAALYAYDPSPLYVTAVESYARRIRRDARAFYALYAWRVSTPSGLRWLR